MRFLISLFLCLSTFAGTQIGSGTLQTYPAEANYNGGINIRPGNGDTVYLNPPIFSWLQMTNVATATWTQVQFWEYQFQISATTSFASPVVSKRTKSNMYNKLAPLTAGNTYYWRVGFIPIGDASTNYYYTNSFTIDAGATSWDRSILADETYLAAKTHPYLLITSTNRAAHYTFSQTNTFNDWATMITRKNNALAATFWTNTAAWDTNFANPNIGTYTLGLGSVLTYWALSQDAAVQANLILNFERLCDWWLSAHYEFTDWGSSTTQPWVLHSLALGFDWLYPVLSSGQKTKAISCLQATARFYNRNAFWSAVANSGHWELDSNPYPTSYTGTRLAVWYNDQRRGTSHQWISSSTVNIIAAVGYKEGGDLREFYDLWTDYMIARGAFTGGFSAINQGRGYTSIGVGNGGIAWNLIAWDALIPEANFERIPWVTGFTDWFSRLTPPGYRGGHGAWSDGADDIVLGFTSYWRNYDFRNLMMFTQSGEAYSAWANETAISGAYSAETYFYQFPTTYHAWPPPSPAASSTGKVFLEDGWAIAGNTAANGVGAFTNGMGFVFAARPRGTEGGHSLNADGVAEFWAYGAKLSDGGAYNLDPYGYQPISQDTILVNGVGMQVNENIGNYSSEQILPYYAKITAFTNTSNYAFVQGDMTYCFQNLYNVQRTNFPTWKRSVEQSKTGKYFVIFDELSAATPSRFDFLWHVRQTNAIAGLSATGFNYFVTNQYNTSTSLRITNYMFSPTTGLTYTNATGGDVLRNQVTGVGFSDFNDPNRRANVLWYRNAVSATNFNFMWVLVPQGVGKAAPVITRIDDLTVKVVYDGVTETNSFSGSQTNATYYVDLGAIVPPTPPVTNSGTASLRVLGRLVMSGNQVISPAATPPTPPVTQYLGVTAYTPGTPRNNFGADLGFTFNANVNMTVLSLGRWKISGNTGTHTVRIASGANGTPGTTLGSVSIDMTTSTAGQFNYVTLSSPVSLSAGTDYWVLSTEPNGGDQWYDETTTGLTYSSDFTLPYSAFTSGGNLIKNNNNYIYIPTNFKYTKP